MYPSRRLALFHLIGSELSGIETCLCNVISFTVNWRSLPCPTASEPSGQPKQYQPRNARNNNRFCRGVGRSGEFNSPLYPVDTDYTEGTSHTEMPPGMVGVGCPAMNEVRSSGTDQSEKKEFCDKHHWRNGFWVIHPQYRSKSLRIGRKEKRPSPRTLERVKWSRRSKTVHPCKEYRSESGIPEKRVPPRMHHPYFSLRCDDYFACT